MSPTHRHTKTNSSELKRLPSEKLTQIEPDPISIPRQYNISSSSNTHPDDEASDTNNNNYAKPPPATTASSTSNLSLKWLQAAQKYSSYMFSAFFLMHATSVIVAPAVFSVPAGDAAMQFSNVIYQASIVEPWLVYGSLGAHIVTGTALRLYKTHVSKQHYGTYISNTSRPSPLAISGYVLTPLVLAHLTETRIKPELVLGDSSLITLQYISHAFAKHNKVLIWSSMSLLVLLSLYHITFGFKKWMNVKPKKWSMQFYSVIAGLTTLGVVSLWKISALGPATGWLATQYDKVLLVGRPDGAL